MARAPWPCTLHGRDGIPGPLGESDAWLAAVLQRVANRLGADPVDASVADTLLDAALRAHAGGAVTLLPSWTDRS